MEFHGHAPLMSNPDPRNIDIHASLHDPFGQFVVRTFRQQSTIPIVVVADLSASMGFYARRRKLDLVAEFSASAAYSAYRTGDAFGFIGCDKTIIWDLFLPIQWHKGRAVEHMDKVKRFIPSGNSVSGFHDAIRYIGKKRALVFLVSDFHFSFETMNAIFDSYAVHDVVPIIVWDTMEFRDLPNRGLIRLRDPETGLVRSLFMRPSFRAKLESAFLRRRDEIIQLCLSHERTPFFILNDFHADDLTNHFLGLVPQTLNNP